MTLFCMKTIGATLIVSVFPVLGTADGASDFEQAWIAAVAPAADQSTVVLSRDVAIEKCRLGYSFTSNGGTVTDAFDLPLTALDVAQAAALSAAPVTTGIVFVLEPIAMEETTKTLANGATRSRPTPYGSLFAGNLTGDVAAHSILEALF